MRDDRDKTEVPDAPPPSGHPSTDTEEPGHDDTRKVEVPATMPTDDEGRPAPPAAS
jgi:hypothetical protein